MTGEPATTLSVQDLLDERHVLKEKTRAAPIASGRWVGAFQGHRRGQGSDFDDLRHYVVGDDVRNIDWKASARTNTLNTRLYREEREHRVTVLVDLRDCMFTGIQQLRAVLACRLAARLLWQATDNGSRARVVIIGDEGVSFSEQSTGHRAAINGCGLLARRFQRIAQRITLDTRLQSGAEHPDSWQVHSSQIDTADASHTSASADSLAQPQEDVMALPGAVPVMTPAGGTTVSGTHRGVTQAGVLLEQAVHWLAQQQPRQGTLFWLSGMDHCGPDFDTSMRQLSQTSSQLAIHIDDPGLRHGLPSGQYSYRVTGGPAQAIAHVSLSAADSRRLTRVLQEQRRQLEQRFDELMIPLLSSELPSDELVSALRQRGYLP